MPSFFDNLFHSGSNGTTPLGNIINGVGGLFDHSSSSPQPTSGSSAPSTIEELENSIANWNTPSASSGGVSDPSSTPFDLNKVVTLPTVQFPMWIEYGFIAVVVLLLLSLFKKRS